MNESTILKRKENIMAADLNGETVMMDIASGKYYNIGSVGGDIWNILENEMSLESLITKLTETYDVTPEQCRADIIPFLQKMIEIGLFAAKQ